jgi:hypothetical protein
VLCFYENLFYKISFTAGAITGAVTTPLDVIKTRLMVQVLKICFLVFFFEGNQ